jgi:crotonobetainyl-CoA:carnitine CoA-transferase CaiB-like acyl-CoA transferase
VIGRPELAEQHLVADAQEELAAELRRAFAARPLADWLELFEQEDVCVGPVATLAEAAAEFGDPALGTTSAPVGEHTQAWRGELGLG